ncbi:MAG TPA: DUF983 domain-containing protein [Planctomycetota bacterium]
MKLHTVLARALRLRCPACGAGALFRGFLRVNDRCASCALDFRQEPGYYVGAMWLNYGATALSGIAAGLLLLGRIPTGAMVAALSGWGLVFPILFFHHSRAIWLGGELWLRSKTTEPGP